ncbi:MAG: hypothetical protein AAGF44_08795 [Pseudomonadota bacterium]
MSALCPTLFRLPALALIGLLAACTAPQGLDASGSGAPAPLLYAEPGTRITLASSLDGAESQREITILAQQGVAGAFQREDGSTGRVFPGCWDCGAPNVVEEDAYARLWPLETGKRVTFLRSAPDGTKNRIVIRVAGTERIETAAGGFDTYLLKGQSTALTGPRWSAELDIWWAPDPGWAVKAAGSDSDGRSFASEAIEIVPPG